jgi:hypothetical protein
MERQEKRLAKKRRGRPATGRGTTIGVRCQDEMLAEVDNWRRKQPDLPTRATAIRRLAKLGLTVKTKAKQPSAARAVRAKELAAKAIDKIIDPVAPPEERAQRRRRPIKGPSEFREDRVDLPRAKGK